MQSVLHTQLAPLLHTLRKNTFSIFLAGLATSVLLVPSLALAAAPTFSNSTDGINGSFGSGGSWSHTVSAGSNQIGFVSCVDSGGGGISSATWNGSSMTYLAEGGNGSAAVSVYYIFSPASGTVAVSGPTDRYTCISTVYDGAYAGFPNSYGFTNGSTYSTTTAQNDSRLVGFWGNNSPSACSAGTDTTVPNTNTDGPGEKTTAVGYGGAVATPAADSIICGGFVVGTTLVSSDYVPPTLGCTDPLAENYDPDADLDDGSCTYDPTGIYGPLQLACFEEYDDTLMASSTNCYGPGSTGGMSQDDILFMYGVLLFFISLATWGYFTGPAKKLRI